MDPRTRSVTAQDVVNLLNAAAKLDPIGMRRLVDARAPCNAALADHPTIQVGRRPGKADPDSTHPYVVGLLGILNGIFGADPDGWGCIAAERDLKKPLGPVSFAIRPARKALR